MDQRKIELEGELELANQWLGHKQVLIKEFKAKEAELELELRNTRRIKRILASEILSHHAAIKYLEGELKNGD
jgi:hypothetical protein